MDISSSPVASKPADDSPGAPVYSRNNLEIFNLLQHPIWVFDITGKSMLWSNKAGLGVWGADSLDNLLSRRFDDMSVSTITRLSDYLRKFKNGESVTEQWTYYPKTKGPVTVNLTMSGIYIRRDDGSVRLCMLNHAETPDSHKKAEDQALRSVEMLRHLPVAVGQMDTDGWVTEQNPQALNLFGPIRRRSQDEEMEGEESGFISRFVDRRLGESILQDQFYNEDNIYRVKEAQLTTSYGLRWFDIYLRRCRDPVTAEACLIYSARDITEKVAAQTEADRAASAKAEFLAVVSHEIRTPLHQVSGFVELLCQTDLSPKQQDYLACLDMSSVTMLSVINDLLDFSKLEAGKMKLEVIPFSLQDVLAGSMAVVSQKCAAKNIRLSTDAPQSQLPSTLLGDPNRLRQLLLNLLQNAVKFTKAGGISLQVRVDTSNTTKSPERTEDFQATKLLRRDNSEEEEVVLRFVVADTGIGITEEHRRHMFQKYQQADSSVAREYGGTGLGLAICKSLVDALKGTIGVDSQVGKGSQFWFCIPFALPPPAVSSRPATPTEVAMEPAGEPGTPSPRGNVPSPRAIGGARSSFNILVAEDNIVNQKLATAMLKRLGHSVKVVSNGFEAVQAIEEEAKAFQLVLMDIQMPVMDGIEATRTIREKFGNELAIIGLTAGFQSCDLQTYQDIGMNSCIGKPIRMNALQNSISENVPDRWKKGRSL